ncbi:histone deacetylase [Acrasis kona]|uniref:Histone deacetylase n=1 Tax=Acrasis kona TaxID=1008807 RepID=A0AAW2ZAU0_9EUKA
MIRNTPKLVISGRIKRCFYTFTPHPSVNPSIKVASIPKRLVERNIMKAENIIQTEKIDLKHLLRAHEESYVLNMINGTVTKQQMQQVGMNEWTPKLIDLIMSSHQGTLRASQSAMETGRSMNLAGGSHHAKYHSGGGYCIFNDIVVSAEAMKALGYIKKYLVIDLDVHQGDGTAQMTRDFEHAYTFSMHCATNYPFVKEKSSWDVELPDRIKDDEYLNKLDSCLFELYQLRSQLHSYDIVYYQAGVDVLQGDRLGKLSLTVDGVRNRDQMVIDFCKKQQVPVVVTLGGGYPNGEKHTLETVVDTHCNTVQILKDY